MNQRDQKNQMDQTDQITRQTGLVSNRRTIEALACRNSFPQAVGALFRHCIVAMTVAKP
jgi:hypothetical protein